MGDKERNDHDQIPDEIVPHVVLEDLLLLGLDVAVVVECSVECEEDVKNEEGSGDRLQEKRARVAAISREVEGELHGDVEYVDDDEQHEQDVPNDLENTVWVDDGYCIEESPHLLNDEMNPIHELFVLDLLSKIDKKLLIYNCEVRLRFQARKNFILISRVIVDYR